MLEIAIQVDGQHNCFGSAQQVTNRNGAEYEVPTKFKPVSPEMRQEYLAEEFEVLNGNFRVQEVVRVKQTEREARSHTPMVMRSRWLVSGF